MHVSSIRNGDNQTFWAQKIALKNVLLRISYTTYEQSPSSSRIHHLEEIATTLFETYLQEVLVNGSQVVTVEIKQKNVDFFSSKNVRNNKSKTKMKSVETCSKVVTYLFVALQQRLADLLQHEISIPQLSIFSEAEINICRPTSANICTNGMRSK